MHFISITSSGGYIGRFAWHNTGVHPDLPHWGVWIWIRSTTVAWAGTLWPTRMITNL